MAKAKNGREKIADDSFPVELYATLGAFEGDGEVSLFLKLNVTGEVPGVITPAVQMARATGSPVSHHQLLSVPFDTFPDKQTRDQWVNKSLARFRRFLSAVLVHEAQLLFIDAGNFYLDFMGVDPDPTPKKELVKIHLNATEKRVAAFIGEKGQRSSWTRAELERAIRNAFAVVRKHERNYGGVLRVLKKNHPSKATPPTVPALKQLVRRNGIDWKALKGNS